MTPEERYTTLPITDEATLHSIIDYLFEEIARRSFQSTQGLNAADLDVDPGQGAMTIGELIKHEHQLLRLILENLQPGASKELPRFDIGGPGGWHLDAMLAYREALNGKFREVWPTVSADTLMALRAEMPPEGWAAWPVLMRFMRPLVDLSTHVGQINYARRQLGKPVTKL